MILGWGQAKEHGTVSTHFTKVKCVDTTPFVLHGIHNLHFIK